MSRQDFNEGGFDNPCTCPKCSKRPNRATFGIDPPNQVLNHMPVTRTPDQMGPAVPIFAPWPTKVKAL